MPEPTTPAIPRPDPKDPIRVVVVSAGLSEVSSTTRLGQFVADETCRQVRARDQRCEIVHIELRHIALAVTQTLISGQVAPEVAAAHEQIARADAMVAATPTINASFSGLLKSFFDTLPVDLLRGLPTVIAATGGTQRHTLVLDSAVRPMLAYLRAVVLSSALFVTADEWEGTAPSQELAERISAAATELIHYAWAARVGTFAI
ncbi:CE1759 family FMN reductase [Aestuariimicrobium ganziense]|uniref:CE1759 family FMN reductase n=1 Tax=Aestuariimicrobium ganziense TaxID=2773677 RepID=UPI001944A003|nr:CE1759 family FMN reductase [Aestuariimicrobium ganziense]